MSNDKTLLRLFELSINAEETARDFYLGLADRFSHQPQAADFWDLMRQEEQQHIRELEKIRKSLRPEQLDAGVDPAIWEKAWSILKYSAAEMLESVQNLNDAYELAHELEFSEVNTVFGFLMTHFTCPENRRNFALAEINQHQSRLMRFAGMFGDMEQRKGITVSDKKSLPNYLT